MRTVRRLVAAILLAAAASAACISLGAGDRRALAQSRAATLTEADARYYVRRMIRQRAGEGFALSGQYSIDCRRRSRLRFRCRFSAFIGDGSLAGSGQVWYSPDPDDDQVHFRHKVTYVDEYCYFVTERSNPRRAEKCTRDASWTN